jgi:hypothetical protein
VFDGSIAKSHGIDIAFFAASVIDDEPVKEHGFG